jgi:hypothetical protein
MRFDKPLATQVAQADHDVDYSLADNALMRPGIYLCYVREIPVILFLPTTLHWYTTPEAETALKSASTPYEFGRAMHAYQGYKREQQSRMVNILFPLQLWPGEVILPILN